MPEIMKAWQVREKDEFYTTVVFAETRGKAKSLALSTDACVYANFCDIEVHREPRMDKYYTEGKTEMDWYNPQDRIALVKECGFVCSEDCFCKEECLICPANEYCDKYIDYIKEIKELEHERNE